MTDILCSTTTTTGSKFGVVKAWLKLNKIEFEVKTGSAGSHTWSTMVYTLTVEQLTKLLSYLREAEVLDSISEIII